MADIFDEVNEELRAERAQKLLQRYGFLLVVAAVLVVVAVGGWQAWRWKQRGEREAVATTFLSAMQGARTPLGTPTPARAEALAAFSRIAAEGPYGYRGLARLQEAALKVAAGDLPGALALWDKVSADTDADPQLRSVADLLWVQHQVDAGDPAAVQGRLARLVAPGSPWRPLGLEAQALLLLRTGDKDRAVGILQELVTMPGALPGVRARAAGMLTLLGQAPPPTDETATESSG